MKMRFKVTTGVWSHAKESVTTASLGEQMTSMRDTRSAFGKTWMSSVDNLNRCKVLVMLWNLFSISVCARRTQDPSLSLPISQRLLWKVHLCLSWHSDNRRDAYVGGEKKLHLVMSGRQGGCRNVRNHWNIWHLTSLPFGFWWIMLPFCKMYLWSLRQDHLKVEQISDCWLLIIQLYNNLLHSKAAR